jgi:PAS domain S-box-containing protein
MTQRRARKQPSQAHDILKARGAERTDALEKANEELKAAQAELQRRWQYLAEAQKLSHSGTFGWKVSSGELVWSDETYRILGFARETNPTLDLVFDRIHPEDLDRMREVKDRAARNGMDLDVEHRILLPDGAIKYLHAVAHAGRDSSGNLEYMGVVTDITERKRADEERQALSRNLHESNARLEEAERVAHLGYWIWNLETNRVVFSNETCRIYGIKPQEDSIDLAEIRDLIHPEDRGYVFENAERAVRDGVHIETEHRLIRPSGEIRIVYSRGDLTRDASGRPYEMFGTCQDITERKCAEEERQVLYRDLQESKASLEEAQRLAHVGSWVWDLEKNHVTYSDEYCRIFGLAPRKDPIDIATVREMIHPEDREYVFRTAEEAIRSGERAECEHRILRPNGEIRIVRSLGDLKKDTSGRPYQMFGVSQDITDRKLAEQALRRNQFYLSEGERLAHIGSWASKDLGIRWSEDLDIYWSDEVYKIFGFDPKNGPPSLQQFLAAVHPQDRASLTETMKMLHEQHCNCDVTNRIVRPDGEIRYVRCVGIAVVENGVFQGFHGTTMDVTEHELLTQELRREQAYLTDAQSMAHIGSWVFNLITHKLLHSSDENARLYGFDPSQGPISPKRFFDTQHAEDAPYVNAALERAVREGTDFYLDEYRIHHTDGSIRFLRAIGHRNASGEPGEYVGVTMDITERKRAEEERERLRQLEAELAHINRVNMMGELAAALAHEIKQPIAASITSANALMRWLAHDPPDLERARATAARIEQDGNRAADVINSLQSFYRTGTPVERHIVDVKETIEEMTVLLRVEADRHSIKIHPELEADTPKTMANRVQLQQVFMNLMLNAIEAMKDTGGELAIRSRANLEGRLVVSISDTGIGLPANSTEQIFEPFHTTKPQGTGMGLTITRSIVESYGGRVWATGNEGAGATFHFILPGETEAHV